MTASPPLQLLYDADCGFCRLGVAALLGWDLRGRLAPVAIQSDDGQRLLAAVAAEERLCAGHVVDGDGRIHTGGAAVPVVAAQLPAGAPVAWLARRLPEPTRRAYGWIADRRTPLGRLVPGVLKRRATSRIARRAATAASTDHAPPPARPCSGGDDATHRPVAEGRA